MRLKIIKRKHKQKTRERIFTIFRSGRCASTRKMFPNPNSILLICFIRARISQTERAGVISDDPAFGAKHEVTVSTLDDAFFFQRGAAVQWTEHVAPVFTASIQFAGSNRKRSGDGARQVSVYAGNGIPSSRRIYSPSSRSRRGLRSASSNDRYELAAWERSRDTYLLCIHFLSSLIRLLCSLELWKMLM